MAACCDWTRTHMPEFLDARASYQDHASAAAPPPG
jgi:hypothetical protein